MPRCPICSAELVLGSSGQLDSWACPQGHGLAMTLSESYEQLQEDEIALLWQRARMAQPGPLTSPFGGAPMVRITVDFDDDEALEGEDGDGPNTGAVVVDVDVPNQFIWFDAGELDELPSIFPTLSRPPPSWPPRPRSSPSSAPTSTPPPRSARAASRSRSCTAGWPAIPVP